MKAQRAMYSFFLRQIFYISNLVYTDIIKNILYLLWSKNSIERLMISSSVIILLSSSATSPRSSLDPLDAI